MSQTRDYLLKRKDELAASIEPLQLELEAVCRALAALDGGARRGTTIKDAVLSALVAGGEMKAADIRRWILSNLGQQIDRTSLSPQLTRLKRDGLLTEQGGKWAIAQVSN